MLFISFKHRPRFERLAVDDFVESAVEKIPRQRASVDSVFGQERDSDVLMELGHRRGIEVLLENLIQPRVGCSIDLYLEESVVDVHVVIFVVRTVIVFIDAV